MARNVPNHTQNMSDASPSSDMEAGLSRWQQLMQLTSDLVWLVDVEGHITETNAAWDAYVDPIPGSSIGRSFLEVIHPDDRGMAEQTWQAAVLAQSPCALTIRLQGSGKGSAWFRVQLVPCLNSLQPPIAWQGIAAPQAKPQAWSSSTEQEFLIALLANLSDGIVACDAAGKLVLFNQAAQEFHGLPAEPIPPEEWANYYSLFQADGVTPLAMTDIPLYRALSGESVSGFEMQIKPKYGEPKILVANGEAIWSASGQKLGAVVAMRDITAYKAAESALRDSERRFRALFNQTFQFIGLLHPDGTLLEANQTALDFGQITAAEVLGKPFWQAPWWRHSVAAQNQLQQSIRQAAQGEFIRYEVDVAGADTTIATIDFSIKPIVDETGQIILLIPEGRDITARKHAEAEIYRLNSELEQRVAQRTAELEAANRQNEALLRLEREARSEAEAAIGEIRIYTERLTLALDAAKMGWWDLDLQADRTVWNPYHEIIFGYPPGTPNRDYIDWERRVHPDDLERVHQATHQARDQQEDLAVQYRIVWPDGQIRWVDAFGRFYYDAENRPIRMLGVLTDVTQRKRTEIALQQGEERFRSLVEATTQIIWNASAKGELVDSQPGWSQFTGQPYKDYIGWGWLNAIHPNDQANTAEVWQIALANHTLYEMEHRLRRHDGEYRYMSVRAVPILENQHVREWIGIHTDITDRKQIELALRDSEARFRVTFEQAAVGMAHVDLSGRWLRVNQVICQIVGYSREELLQKTFQQVTFPDDLEQDLGLVQQLLDGQLENYSLEKRYIRKDGSLVWVNITVSLMRKLGEVNPFSASLGQPEYFIVIVQDISDRKASELLLQQQKAELTNLNVSLVKTSRLLEERNQDLDRFVYIVSHDLKAPLRGIANLAEWIEDDVADLLPEENKHQLQLMRQRVERMNNLINGVLEYSRAGRKEVPIEWVDVNQLVAEIVDSIDVPSGFNVVIIPPMPTLLARRLLLNQVLMNLISNAVKYHDRPDGQIQIGARDMGQHYEFWVQDDGPGIPPEHHNRIFEIFQTLKPQSNQNSTGIGLSIVKKIVEVEGGIITLDSQVGEGSTFRFTWLKCLSST